MNRTKIYLTIFMVFIIFFVFCVMEFRIESSPTWSEDELRILNTLALDRNANENGINTKLAKLGKELFFDATLSENHDISCATCHQPTRFFSDGKMLSSTGEHTAKIHTPTLIGASSSQWFFWDGRKDSLWSQALEPLENHTEHGTNRLAVVKHVTTRYKAQYYTLFGTFSEFSMELQKTANATPMGENTKWQKNWYLLTEKDRKKINRIFANTGLAIAEYQKLIQPGLSRFDKYVHSLSNREHNIKQKEQLTAEEIYGLKLFLDSEKTTCINCHNGPLFSNFDFQATGIRTVFDKKRRGRIGRIAGINTALKDEFNCFSGYVEKNCDELRYAKKEGSELIGAFKVPTLRNVADTAPYMHSGDLSSLDEVLTYYNKAKTIGNEHIDIQPLRLRPHELKQLKAFLTTLSAPLAMQDHWLTPTKL
ncbi:cytochrome-c peroxidase [Teredinibacter franksiae]|uniref:cytochrome-c peroxidase n=1 Tax=Teredinibacter franksiae TaxID=2761453 RepID=UPI00162677C7|nr:cytochrome c peroxidase [Teredinibacter franksiae]